MKFLKYSTLIILCLILFSCGSKKLASGAGTVKEDATAAFVIKQHYANAIDFKTMQAKLRVAYEDEDNSQNFTVSLRMKNDEVIWLSGGLLGITMAKVMITPTRVRYYEKLNGTYFDGNFELLSDWLGLPLDFEKVQNLLLGQALYNLEDEAYVAKQSEAGYQLEPANASSLLTKLFLLNPSNFKIQAEQFAQPKENRNVTLTYPEYQVVNGKIAPNLLEIRSNSPEGSTYIHIDYDDIDFNKSVNFPFSIPKGYDEISLE